MVFIAVSNETSLTVAMVRAPFKLKKYDRITQISDFAIYHLIRMLINV